jgi:hypothetical protein
LTGEPALCEVVVVACAQGACLALGITLHTCGESAVRP